MQIKIPHNLSAEQATSRIKNLLDKIKNGSNNTITNINQTWDGNVNKFSFTAKGLSVSGDMQVNPSLIIVNLKLPLAAMLFRGKIKSIIEEEAKKVLS